MQCAISFCDNKSPNTRRWFIKGQGPLVTYHKFPTDEDLRRLWIKACKRKKGYFVSKTDVRICSEHFEEDDFVRDLRAELLKVKARRTLKPNAVPTLKLTSLSKNKNTKTVCNIERQKRSERKSRKEFVEKILEEATREKEQTQESATSELCEVPENEAHEFVLEVSLTTEQQQETEQKKTDCVVDEPQCILSEKETEIVNQLDKVKELVSNCPGIIQTVNELGKLLKDNAEEPALPLTGENTIESLKREKEYLEKKNALLECELAKTKHELNKSIALCRSRTTVLGTSITKLKEEVQKLNLLKPSSSQSDSEMLEVLETFLTDSQIRVVMHGCKKPMWTEPELATALRLRKISERAYVFMQKTLNYPLPEMQLLDRFASRTLILKHDSDESDCDKGDLECDDFTSEMDCAECNDQTAIVEYEIEVSEPPPPPF